MQCSTGWLGARFGMEAQHEHHGRCEAVSMEARPPEVGQRTPVRTRRTVRPTTHTVMQTSATTCSRPQPPTAAGPPHADLKCPLPASWVAGTTSHVWWMGLGGQLEMVAVSNCRI